LLDAITDLPGALRTADGAPRQGKASDERRHAEDCNANEEVEMSSQITLAQLPVGQIGFGAMRITGLGIWGPPKNEGEAIALLRRAVEKGVTFIDTADSYGPGISETLIAKALHPYPTGLVVATKGGLVRPGADSWVTDCRPEHLRHACTDSLERLRLECIELYQLHAVDHRIPIEDSIGALVDLQREGKIRHIGVSNVSERELVRARAVASIVSVQNHYNLRDKSSDRLIDICTEAGMAFIPWYPLAAGRLANPNSLLARIAQSHGATPSQIALAWLLQRSPAMLPIPGTSSIAHLEENLAAASIRLTSDEFRTLASS
jgi:aryl-alcohol dehydrogenase-like predicted oxidoreductase